MTIDAQAVSRKDTLAHSTRRDFLRAGTVATTAVAAGLSTRALANNAASSPNEVVNIGIVGCGGRGGGAVNDNLSINENVRLVAAADIYEDKCRSLVERTARKHEDKVAVSEDKMYGGLDGYKKVLEDPDVDLVLLTTSPGFRPYHDAHAHHMLTYGATAHFIIPELDAGDQIIHQSTFTVFPGTPVEEIIRIGESDNEPQCLAEGLRRVVDREVELHFHRVVKVQAR